MKKFTSIAVLCLISAALFLSSCALFQGATQKTAAKKAKKVFHQKVPTTISLRMPEKEGLLNADVYRPLKSMSLKTLVIIVPGSGNVSRLGETFGDGVNNFDEPVYFSQAWAEALADHGVFVLSYDKRSCSKQSNSICNTNDQSDLDKDGMLALARDLDEVYDFAKSRLGQEARIILLSSTQGAQVISLSKSANIANGFILISPIINDLQLTWTTGLNAAAEAEERFSQKNDLLNRKESTAAFFQALERGDFPESASIRGASVKFWKSWIDAANNTLASFKYFGQPALFMFSKEDVFSSDEILRPLVKMEKSAPNFIIKQHSDTDRNFIKNGTVDAYALKEVLNFLQK